jgi:carbon monoxide dehydrogenase subunit G
MASEQRIAASRQRVWEALNDPEVLRSSIPGCNSLDKVSDERFDATVEVKVGPIGARFKGTVSLTNLDPPNQYTLILEGNGGIAGSVKGSADVRLTEDSGGTMITYVVDAQVGGRMAQLGGPIIDATAKQLAGKFFSRFGENVAPSAAPAAAAKAPSVAAGTGAAPAIRPAAAPRPGGGFPLVWMLSSVIVALAGFMVGRSEGAATSDWAGLAVGMLVVVVAAAAFEYGRRAATPVVTLDNELLRRLIDEARK